MESEKPLRRPGSGPRKMPCAEGRSKPRVLVVEDDGDMRELYSWGLLAGGWLVAVASDGQEALYFADDFEPDAIVMDLRLPVIDGFEAIRRLKSDERTSHIPVVAVSGANRSQAEDLARRAGCDAFVPKPCAPEDLCALLEDLVTLRTGTPP
jgi:two-component system cell cycle response regulator DivK